jgi:hypothetical protein
MTPDYAIKSHFLFFLQLKLMCKYREESGELDFMFYYLLKIPLLRQ